MYSWSCAHDRGGERVEKGYGKRARMLGNCYDGRDWFCDQVGGILPVGSPNNDGLASNLLLLVYTPTMVDR